jgi:hypothetical protein
VITDQKLGLSSAERSWELKICYPTHPYSHEICRAIALTGNLSIQVIRYLEHVSIYTLYLDHVRQGIATAEEEKYLLEFGPSLYQESENADLVRKIGIRSCTVGPSGTHVEQCIALALKLWNLVAFNKTRLSPMYRHLVQALASSIEQVELDLELTPGRKQEQRSTLEPELSVSQFRIWVAIFAAGACQGVKALTTLGTQIMDDVLCRYDEARSWQRIEVILGRFFEHEALVGEWKSCWREATRRRVKREVLLP